LFVVELLLNGFSGGCDLVDIFDEEQGEVHGLGQLAQIEVFLQ
jgi:hypothetical protein